MKKLTFIFGLLIISIGIFAQADSTVLCNSSIKDLTHSTSDALIGGAMNVISLIKWGFLIILVGCASVFNEAVEAENWATTLTFLKKMPRGLRTLLLGILFMILTCWAYEIKDRIAILGFILTIFASMIILSIGLNKIIRFISERFGLKFGK